MTSLLGRPVPGWAADLFAPAARQLIRRRIDLTHIPRTDRAAAVDELVEQLADHIAEVADDWIAETRAEIANRKQEAAATTRRQPQ